MIPPKELAEEGLATQLLELLNRTDEWPLIAVADALADYIKARDKRRAEEFRRLAAANAQDAAQAHSLNAPQAAARYNVRADVWEQAAQMVEDKLG